MRAHLQTLEREIDSLIVKSLADGNMLVEIKYKEAPGVFCRLAIADEIGELIYEHIGKIRRKRDKRKKVSNVKLTGSPASGESELNAGLDFIRGCQVESETNKE